MSHPPATAMVLAEMQPQRPFFVGVDSDGCALDAMELKHKECFCPNTIKWWNLQAVSRYARETAEFVNLYSKWRGTNRWPALVMVLDLLRERPEVIARGARVPEVNKLREFVTSGYQLSDSGLEAYIADHPDSELDRALTWSKGVSESVQGIAHGAPPFPFVRESLQALQDQADVVAVSATPLEALTREWEDNDLTRYTRILAGQEMGTKQQQLALATMDKYQPGRILMIGDALGDLQAARINGALFYPINPGHEERSWERFYREGLRKFLNSQYAGEYESALIAEFEQLLPDTPPWKK